MRSILENLAAGAMVTMIVFLILAPPLFLLIEAISFALSGAPLIPMEHPDAAAMTGFLMFLCGIAAWNVVDA